MGDVPGNIVGPKAVDAQANSGAVIGNAKASNVSTVVASPPMDAVPLVNDTPVIDDGMFYPYNRDFFAYYGVSVFNVPVLDDDSSEVARQLELDSTNVETYVISAYHPSANLI